MKTLYARIYKPCCRKNYADDGRVPKAFVSLEILPFADDRLQLGYFPLSPFQGDFRGRIKVHNLELEQHVQLFVLWKAVFCQRALVMREWCLSNCHDIVV